MKVKHFKVVTLPTSLQPDSIYYVKAVGETTVKTYVTDVRGVATPLEDKIGEMSAPSWTVYGSEPFGKYGNEQVVPAATSAYLQYKEAWTNIAPPVYLPPLANITSTPATTNLEVGQSINVDLTLLFTQRDGGAETARSITRNGTPIIGTTDTLIVSGTPTNYQGNISYAQGPIKNNQVGVPKANGRIPTGNVPSNIITYTGSYFNFFGVGVVAITSSQIRALTGKTTANTFQLILPAGQQQTSFAYPATKADILDSSVKYVEGFNSNVGATFTKSLFNVNDAGGNPIAYKIYTVQLPAPETGQVTYNVTLP